MDELEYTEHSSLFSFWEEHKRRIKEGYVQIKRDIVKRSVYNTVIKAIWSKPIMKQEQYIELHLEVGANTANEFARDAGVCNAQVQLWETQQKTRQMNKATPRDYSFLMEEQLGV